MQLCCSPLTCAVGAGIRCTGDTWIARDLGRCPGRVVIRRTAAARAFARALSAYQCARGAS